MALKTVHLMKTVALEIGRVQDWKTMSLVEAVGTMTMDDEAKTELEVVRAGASFELWHPNGMKCKIKLHDFLSDAAELFLKEITK